MDIKEEMIKAKEGNEESILSIIEAFTPTIKSLVRKIYLDNQQVEDLLQYGNMFILKGIEKVNCNKSSGEIINYINFTIKNNFNYLLRGNIKFNNEKVITSYGEEDKNYIDNIESRTNIQKDYEFKELKERLYFTLESLNEKERELIIALYLQDKPITLRKYCLDKGLSYSKIVRKKKEILNKLKVKMKYI